MNKNVVRIQYERFKPGEIVRGHGIDLCTKPPMRYAWYPQMPRFTMLDDPEGIHSLGHPGRMLRLDDGGILFRFNALGTECDGITSGDIEALLTTIPASELFAEDMPHLAEMGEMRLDVFQDHALWAMLAIYDVDVINHHVDFEASLDLVEVSEIPDEVI